MNVMKHCPCVFFNFFPHIVLVRDIKVRVNVQNNPKKTKKLGIFVIVTREFLGFGNVGCHMKADNICNSKQSLFFSKNISLANL